MRRVYETEVVDYKLLLHGALVVSCLTEVFETTFMLRWTWYAFCTGLEVIHILSKCFPLPKPYTTDVLTKAQIEFIAQQLPSPKATTSRPAYSNLELLPGILRVLRRSEERRV